MAKDPKEFDLKKHLEGHIKAENDEEKQGIMEKLDLDNIKKAIDEEYVNPIVKHRQEKERENARKEAMEEAQKKVLEEIGIEADNLEGAKAWRKRLESNTDEKDEMLSNYEKQVKELQEQAKAADEYKSKYEKEQSIRNLMEKGAKTEYAEDAYILAQARVSEDKPFDAALEEVKKSHAHLFKQSGAGGQVDPDDPDLDEADKDVKRWEEKYGKLN